MLREYQVKAIDTMRERIKSGVLRNILVCPTGAGKTVIASEIVRLMRNNHKRVLFLVHRKELIDQAYHKFKVIGADITVCRAGDTRKSLYWDVTIATIQTLINRELPEVDLIIVDECHLSAAPTWQEILAEYECPIIGLTATPFRLDGKSLGSIYNSVDSVTNMSDLVSAGFLVPLEWRVLRDTYQLRKDQVGDVYEAWHKYALNLKTIVFAYSVEHSKHIEEKFNGLAKHIDSKMTQKERELNVQLFKDNKIKILTNVGLLSEGFDVPDCECIILARPTESLALYMQQVGRGMRPSPGKTKCLILDLAGNIYKHGFPHEVKFDGIHSPSKAKSYKIPKVSVKICEECFIANSMWPCFNCGWSPKPKTKEEIDLELEDIAKLYPEGSLKYYVEIGKKKGYKPGWAYYRHRSGLNEKNAAKPVSRSFCEAVAQQCRDGVYSGRKGN
jgi:DNA repair protein RadD